MFTALYDACVLYPAPLRDLLIRLALTGLFRARWSEHIHDEWIRNVLRDRPDLSPGQLRRTRELMNRAVDDCLVEGHEPLADHLCLPDPDDRHVLAAAICGRAEVIVTYNLRDFPENALAPHGVRAQHPDHFITSTTSSPPYLNWIARGSTRRSGNSGRACGTRPVPRRRCWRFSRSSAYRKQLPICGKCWIFSELRRTTPSMRQQAIRPIGRFQSPRRPFPLTAPA